MISLDVMKISITSGIKNKKFREEASTKGSTEKFLIRKNCSYSVLKSSNGLSISIFNALSILFCQIVNNIVRTAKIVLSDEIISDIILQTKKFP
jgi:hypothetical protein